MSTRKNTAQLKTIHEDDCVRITHSAGLNSKRAFISFTGIGLKLGGIQQHEFSSSMGEICDVYYVTDFRRSWFNDCASQIIEVLTSSLRKRGTSEVVTLGNSMGGSGAIAFSGAIPGCETAIAFAPQSSINSSVAPFENRYYSFASQVRDWQLPDLTTTVKSSVKYHIFVGGNDGIDMQHAERFRATSPGNCFVYVIPGADHNVARILKSSGISFSKLITASQIGQEAVVGYIQNLRPKIETNVDRAFHPRQPAFFKAITIDTNPRNDLEMQLFGLQRSGNHGVISWITQQFDEKAYFFNNVSHFKDPVTNWHIGNVPNTIQLPPKGSKQLEQMRVARKAVLICSYENLQLNLLSQKPLLEDHDSLLGVSKRVVRILLLRDFFNWVSSRLKLFDYRGQNTVNAALRIDTLIDLWLLYAREFLGATTHLGNTNVVKISYPRWAVDSEYRAWILGALGAPLKNNVNDHVPNVGGGSSFDTTTYSGRAGEMAIQNRWGFFLEDDRFGFARERVGERRAEIEPLNKEIFDAPWVGMDS